jgi:hypothetical protein
VARVTALFVTALALLAAGARANVIETLDAGKGEQAVRMLSEGLRADSRAAYIRLLYAAIGRYIEGKGAADPANARALAEIAARHGKVMLASKDVEAAALGAEGLLLLARQRVAAEDPGWLEAWREAARSLVPPEEAGEEMPWARVRAIEMLCEAALQPGAPGDALLEEARGLAPEGDGAPALAFRLGLARYEFLSRGRKVEAETALQAFAALRNVLEADPSDVDRATIFNDAVSFSKRRKLALKAELLLDPLDAASLSLAIPRSRRWVVHEQNEYGAELRQLGPGGLPRAEIQIFNLPADAPGDSNLRSSNTVRANGFFGTARNHFGKIRRERKPATVSLSSRMKGIGYEVTGSSSNGCARSSRGFVFRGKRAKDSFGAILCLAHGEGCEGDPEVEAFLAAVRDE